MLPNLKINSFIFEVLRTVGEEEVSVFELSAATFLHLQKYFSITTMSSPESNPLKDKGNSKLFVGVPIVINNSIEFRRVVTKPSGKFLRVPE